MTTLKERIAREIEKSFHTTFGQESRQAADSILTLIADKMDETVDLNEFHKELKEMIGAD